MKFYSGLWERRRSRPQPDLTSFRLCVAGALTLWLMFFRGGVNKSRIHCFACEFVSVGCDASCTVALACSHDGSAAAEWIHDEIPQVGVPLDEWLANRLQFEHFDALPVNVVARVSSVDLEEVAWLNQYAAQRVQCWLWRKHGCTKPLWAANPREVLKERYGLYRLPTQAAWTQARA